MSSNCLATSWLLERIDLFERSFQPVADTEGQRLRGIPGWDLGVPGCLPPDDGASWIACIGYAGSFPAPCGDERLPVALEEDEDPSRYRYRCPETFRRKYLPAAEAALYAVRPAPLLGTLADLLDIPHVQRRGIECPAIEGLLWHLGKARIGAAHTDIWCVRGLAYTTAEVFRHFHSPALPDQGLIFTFGQALPELVPPPRHYRIAALRDLIIDSVPTPTLDKDLLQRILAAPVGGSLRPVLPVHFDEYTHTLTIRSHPKPWGVKGQRQAAAVQYLFTQAQQGRWLLPAHEILGAVYPNQATARSQRLQNLFSGNPQWTDYIDNPARGLYGFRLD